MGIAVVGPLGSVDKSEKVNHQPLLRSVLDRTAALEVFLISSSSLCAEGGRRKERSSSWRDCSSPHTKNLFIHSFVDDESLVLTTITTNRHRRQPTSLAACDSL